MILLFNNTIIIKIKININRKSYNISTAIYTIIFTTDCITTNTTTLFLRQQYVIKIFILHYIIQLVSLLLLTILYYHILPIIYIFII